MPPYNGNGGADISDSLIDDLDILLMEFDELRLNRIVTHLNQHYIEPGKLAGCDILLGRYNTPIFRACLGYADRERKKKIEEDTIYRIYSMTKPIVSVALMQLYEGGYFQLNDRISRVVPEWGPTSRFGLTVMKHRTRLNRSIVHQHSAMYSPILPD